MLHISNTTIARCSRALQVPTKDFFNLIEEDVQRSRNPHSLEGLETMNINSSHRDGSRAVRNDDIAEYYDDRLGYVLNEEGHVVPYDKKASERLTRAMKEYRGDRSPT